MNYGELKARLKSLSHRKDLDTQLPYFIDDARIRLNFRLGLDLAPFINDADTNATLDLNPLLYLYAAMQALLEHILEFESAEYFHTVWLREVEGYYTTRAGTEPLVITPEEPTP